MSFSSSGSSIQPAGIKQGAEVANWVEGRLFKPVTKAAENGKETHPCRTIEIPRSTPPGQSPDKLIREGVAVAVAGENICRNQQATPSNKALDGLTG